ncbi:MAG: tetratricopeptide repeat protein [Kiritimatiellae bacterium]|nr:tetratricopeptide repeat protein [Kiritimatiellia bacterium]
MTKSKIAASRLLDVVVASALGAVALVLYFASMANYAFPGESAHLMAVWRGLDIASETQYPLMGWFVRLFGVGNGLFPVLGALGVVLFYYLTSAFLRLRMEELEGGEARQRAIASCVALAGGVVLMCSPAYREASTHLEPRLFAFVWAMLTLFVLRACSLVPTVASAVVALAAGVMAGFGLCDSPLFLAALPLFLAAAWVAERRAGRAPWLVMSLFVLAFLLAAIIFALVVSEDFPEFARQMTSAFAGYFKRDGWLFVVLFSTVPFALALFSSGRSLRGARASLAGLLFHVALAFVSILAIATPLSPAELMEPYAILPVAPSAFAAFSFAYLAAFWFLQSREIQIPDNLNGPDAFAAGIGRVTSFAFGGILAFVAAFSTIFNLFDFEKNRGAFADRVAEKALADLGDRKWFITDGIIDDHLLLAAERLGKDVQLVSLKRDLDDDYLKRLGEIVKEAGLGGERNQDLTLALTLGVLPFVQEWFTISPDVARTNAVVWGAADLWYGSGINPVPEFLFFGAEPEKGDAVDFRSDWKAFSELLYAPEQEGDRVWGSYRLARNKNPIERMRLDLRRHLGLVANNRGVWLQDSRRPAEAFDMFELVLAEIDNDNISALFNEFELARTGEAHAAAKKKALEARLNSIKDDKDRRYRLWALNNYYGYIRSPEIFVRLGFNWARSGRPGEALQQIRRAIDFVPSERRSSLMNMMASIYASGDERDKSRSIYENVLAGDPENHDALLGLMRVEMMEGNNEKAMEYLAHANELAGDDPRSNIERAMLHMMRNELDQAKALLKKATDADNSNLQAWSFLAAVTIQQIDNAKDARVRAALMKELENEILATMEKQSRDPSDYYVQTTRAFLLLRKGQEYRKSARDAFVAASRDRPDISATSDMILGLDISLNDTVDAERHARDVLRRNSRAPLANYVMGSLALQRGEYVQAEAFLRRSVDSPKPVVLALNDLAEVLRRSGNLEEAELYARKAVATDPNLYVAWDTLGTIILERKGSLDEAEECIKKACDLSRTKDGKEADVRMLITLARVQLARGDRPRGKGTLRKVLSRIDELSEFERKEFEELRKSGR